MKGFTRDHKFVPMTDYKKVTTKSRDQHAKTQGVKIRKARISIEQKFSKADIQGGHDFFDNWICEHPQEWLFTLGDEDSKYPFSKKLHDNLWEHNNCGWAVWDDDEGRYASASGVVVLTNKDKDSIIRYWIDERKEDDLEDKRVDDRNERIENKVRAELSEATGVKIQLIKGEQTTMQNFQVDGFEGEHNITTILPFSVTPDKLDAIKKAGYEILSVGNGIKVKKGGFE